MWIRFYINKLCAHLFYRRKNTSLWFTFYMFLFFLFFYGLFKNYLQLESHGNVSDELKWFEEHNNLSHFLDKVPYSKNVEASCDARTVVVAVISAPPNHEARRAIRSSWGKHLPLNWKLWFFVGKSINKTIENGVMEEINRLGDVIQLDVKESYTNLTIKVYLMFHWINQLCNHSKFLIKIDDDVYLSPKNIRDLINCSSLALDKMYEPNALLLCDRKWNISNLVGHFIDKTSGKYVTYIAGGYLYHNVKADRNVNSKWYLSSSLYDSPYLPEFLSGTSYFMSMNLLPYVLKSSSNIPAVNLEDLYFTGLIMRRALNLKLSHIKGWSRFRPRWDDACLYNKLVTAHGLEPQELINITEAVLTVGDNCTFLMNLFSLVDEIVSYLFPRYNL